MARQTVYHGPRIQSFRSFRDKEAHHDQVWAIAGLAQRDGVAEARFEASLNDRALGAAENMADLQRLGGGTARAVRFACPLDAVKDGYNQLSIRQVASSKAQQIVWVELRLHPN